MDIRIPEHKGRWMAALSNGTIATEGKGKYKVIEGKLSPWQRLQEDIIKDKLSITSLKFIINGQTYNLMSQKPRFTSIIPIDYNYFRKVIADVKPKKSTIIDRYVCIEAIYTTFKVQLWISETDKGESWLSVVPTK